VSTLSLRSRIIGALARPSRRYGGHRTLEDVIATSETLLRLRGDVNDSAVRVADLEGILQAALDFQLDAGGPGSGNWNSIIGKPDTFPPSEHSHLGTYVRITGDTMTGALHVDMPASAEVYVNTLGGTFANFRWQAAGQTKVTHQYDAAQQYLNLFMLNADSSATNTYSRYKATGETELYWLAATAPRLITSRLGGTLLGDWVLGTTAVGQWLWVDDVTMANPTARRIRGNAVLFKDMFQLVMSYRDQLDVDHDPASFVVGDIIRIADGGNTKYGSFRIDSVTLNPGSPGWWLFDVTYRSGISNADPALVAQFVSKANRYSAWNHGHVVEEVSHAVDDRGDIITGNVYINPAAATPLLELTAPTTAYNPLLRFAVGVADTAAYRASVQWHGVNERLQLLTRNAAGASGSQQIGLQIAHAGAVEAFFNNKLRLITSDAGGDLSGTWNVGEGLYINSVGKANLSAAAPSGKTLPTTPEVNAVGIFFKPDGLKMFTVGASVNLIRTWVLSVPWDISTAVYAGATTDPDAATAPVVTPHDLYFQPDGLAHFMISSASALVTKTVLGTAWQANSFGATTQLDASGHGVSSFLAVVFSPDGLNMYLGANANMGVHQWKLTNPFDFTPGNCTFYAISTPTLIQCRAIQFNETGRFVYVMSPSTDLVYLWELTTPWDITTAADTGQSARIFGAGEDTPSAMFFRRSSGAGTRQLFSVGQTTDTVEEYLARPPTTNVDANISLMGALYVEAPLPVSYAAVANISPVAIIGRTILCTGTTYTLTLPTASALDALVQGMQVDQSVDFAVVSKASGVVTIGTAGGWTLEGTMTIPAGASAQFRARRTAATPTYTLYRIA